MTRKRSKNRKPAPTQKKKRQARKQPSLAIPIVVSVIALVLVVAVLVSLRERRSAGTDGRFSTVSTAQPLAPQPIPFPTVPRATLDETQKKLELGQAVLIDVRSSASYVRSRAQGAVSFPEEEIEARLEELPRDKDLVLY